MAIFKTLHSLLFIESQTVRSTLQSFLIIKHEQPEELERQITTNPVTEQD